MRCKRDIGVLGINVREVSVDGVEFGGRKLGVTREHKEQRRSRFDREIGLEASDFGGLGLTGRTGFGGRLDRVELRQHKSSARQCKGNDEGDNGRPESVGLVKEHQYSPAEDLDSA